MPDQAEVDCPPPDGPKIAQPHRSSPQQRWDARYTALSAEAPQSPTPFVAACLAHLPRQGHALDVAAGAGRHSLALAQHGLKVDAVDISRQGLHLARQQALAAGFSLGRDLCFIVADLERPWLPQRNYEVIVVSFFLYRPLFPLLKVRLRPNGWLVYETLLTNQGFDAEPAPTRPEFLLQSQELKEAFADFEHIFYDEVNQPPRATAQLLARKPAAREASR